MSNQLFRYLTTTVGLVTVAHDLEVNVMAAEWSYFVARDPLHLGVAIGDGAYTQGLIEEAGEFAVTLCSASQASLANFVGSFSGSEIDKTSSRLIELVPGLEIATPRVAGGVFSAECRVAADLELPGFKLFVGEALAVYVDEDASREPLVKHGAMYRLGEPIYDDRIAVAAELVDGTVRVAASVQTGERIDAPWTVSLVSEDGRRRALGEVASNEYGDMYAEFGLAEAWPAVAVSACRVLVERPDASPGWASVSTRLTSAPAQNGNGRVPLSAQLTRAPADLLALQAREVNQA
jgi:flavin reductase (DIM6/NTAB) family NADH-FMN oxidoreductase RutF